MRLSKTPGPSSAIRLPGWAPKVGETGIETGGALGLALDFNLSHRLKTFIVDEESEAVAMFSPARSTNHAGDWYGEHVGKWLMASCLAVQRTGDQELLTSVVRVADALVSYQAADGYLGTYADNAPAKMNSGRAHEGANLGRLGGCSHPSWVGGGIQAHR